MHTSFDTLIVGQGLAGSLLAYQLIERKQRVLVVDNSHHASSSTVAAGIINPISGHRLNINEGFERYFGCAENLYLELNKLFKSEIYQQIPQLRLLRNEGQRDYFHKRLKELPYQGLISEEMQPKLAFLDAKSGVVRIEKTAIVDTNTLLLKMKSRLEEQDSLLNEKFDYHHLQPLSGDNQGVRYKDIGANNIVFCEGFQAIENPWLQNLPFKLAKGEIAEVRLKQANNILLNWGQWLTPSNDNGISKVGSNFLWNDLGSDVNEANCASFIDAIYQQTGIQAELVSARAGVRPTTKHRIPFIGPLSNLAHGYCFNGFGSKGCLIIPSFAQQMCDHLINGQPLSSELTKWL